MYRIFFLKIERFLIRARVFHYKRMFGNLGKSSQIFGRLTVYYPHNIMVGKHSSINEGVVLNARSKILIGDNVHISPHVIINTGMLDYIEIGADRLHISKPVVVNDGVWIGSGAIINPGISIGINSVIGAGAVVTRDIPDNCVAVGVPAKIIKKLITK